MPNAQSPLVHRPRRLRAQPWLRELTQEHRLHPSDLIWPIFIQEGENQETPIPTLPGVSRLSMDLAIQQAGELHQKGLKAVALFPVTPTELKTDTGDEALNDDNLICRTIRAFKHALPSLGLITDVALDPYTTHGHDGILGKGGDVENDSTVEILCKQAVVQAQAGADIIAPSDMMDGRVGAIRDALDKAGHTNTSILSYTAKYASALYGPFRDAVGSNTQGANKTTPPACGGGRGGAVPSEQSIDGSVSVGVPPLTPPPQAGGIGSCSSPYLSKLTYQMHTANSAEALKEATLDVVEGVDMLMVKPGLPYLDIIQTLNETFDLPILAYHVSGEYAGVMFAAEHGAVDAQATLMEHMLCFKRAGATAILTYAAPILLENLK